MKKTRGKNSRATVPLKIKKLIAGEIDTPLSVNFGFKYLGELEVKQCEILDIELFKKKENRGEK
jgi:hypothetical protein